MWAIERKRGDCSRDSKESNSNKYCDDVLFLHVHIIPNARFPEVGSEQDRRVLNDEKSGALYCSYMKKVILITGTSSGIGKATAKCLLKDGHIIYGASRGIEQMRDLEAEGASVFEMDITKSDDITHVVNTLIEREGRIDVLFNNAGYGAYGAVEDVSVDEARQQFEVNLFGLAELTKLVIPHMREQGSGRIINTSSMGGKIYMPLGAWYHASKHALEGWSDALRFELAQFGIDVVIIEPGIIDTNFTDGMVKPMLERSGSGPYGKLANAMAESTEHAYDHNSSPPDVIAKMVAKAIEARKPKTRYVAGRLARPLLFIRKYLGDRVFDWLLRKYIN